MFRFATIILRVFIETDDCLAKKRKRFHRSCTRCFFVRGRKRLRLFPYVCEYENTKQPPRRVHPPPPFHRWDKSMIHEFTVDELARSFHEITRYKPIPVDSPRFVNHRPFLLSLLVLATARRDAAAKFSSDKISAEQLYREMSWAESLFSTNGFPWNR